MHLILSYDADGTIRAYRNGEPWGEPIRKADLQPYPKGKAEFLFGLRHGTKAGNKQGLRGRILEGRLLRPRPSPPRKPRRLRRGPRAVTRDDLDAALGESGVAERQRLEAELHSLGNEARGLESLGANLDLEPPVWRDLAHAIFNLKEFVYLR